MIIIVEGPDGAGKTTLINKLLTQYPHAKTYHFGAPAKGEDQLLRYALPMINSPDDMLIYDRSWYSEFVYGPVMRGVYELKEAHCRLLEALAKHHGGSHVFYLTAPIDILWERCQERGETYIPSKKCLQQISEEYDTVMNTLPELPVFKVDTSR